MKLSEINIGDKVYIDGYTSMAQQNSGVRNVIDTKYKYDEDTGERYKVIVINNGEFDSRTGASLNGNSMYYIETYK
jgi:hypothetical protein